MPDCNPSSGPEHRYPVDCWRFYPDGMRAFAKIARLHCIEVYTDWDNSAIQVVIFGMTVLVVRKPNRAPVLLGIRHLQSLQRRVMSVAMV